MAALDEVGAGTAGHVLFCATLHDLFWHSIGQRGNASEECEPLAHDADTRSPPAALTHNFCAEHFHSAPPRAACALRYRWL